MARSFSHLPGNVIEDLMGGLVLSYYRGLHPQKVDLELVREFRVPHHGKGRSASVDFAIYDRTARQPVALFEVITSKSGLRDKTPLLKRLKTYLEALPGRQPTLGIVVPESLAK